MKWATPNTNKRIQTHLQPWPLRLLRPAGVVGLDRLGIMNMTAKPKSWCFLFGPRSVDWDERQAQWFAQIAASNMEQH